MPVDKLYELVKKGVKLVENNNFNLVVYLANRIQMGVCSRCTKEFLFMVGTMVPAVMAKELHIECPSCGKWGKVSFDVVKDNLKKEGYYIETIYDFIEIQKQVNSYNKITFKKQEG